ncbi:MAG: SDR family oxidoreductase [Persicimonas sp.]
MARTEMVDVEPAQIDEKLADAHDTLDEDVLAADVLLTGFPGFLATNLLERLVALQSDATFYLLIQAKFRRRAEACLERFEERHPDFAGRWELLEGDITDRFLGLGEDRYAELAETVGIVWHLAAIYDLAVPEQLAYRVNVTGTIHLLDFCESCADLKRLNYVSTCYVAGERQGMIYEDELDEGQGHKNHYESTKFWAEVEVQRRADQVPSVIFRPGIVVGDSRTGTTFKYDGPYFLIKLLHRLPDWLPTLNVGKGESMVNLVPVDYTTDAMAYLGNKEGTVGEVFQLADPNPMRAGEVISLVLDCMDRAPALASLPAGLVELAMSRPKIEEMTGMPKEALVYFNHDARFDTSNTDRELEPTSIRCPHLSTYMQTLVDFFLRYPDLEEKSA